jgi:hypothetical protein
MEESDDEEEGGRRKEKDEYNVCRIMVDIL